MCEQRAGNSTGLREWLDRRSGGPSGTQAAGPLPSLGHGLFYSSLSCSLFSVVLLGPCLHGVDPAFSDGRGSPEKSARDAETSEMFTRGSCCQSVSRLPSSSGCFSRLPSHAVSSRSLFFKHPPPPSTLTSNDSRFLPPASVNHLAILWSYIWLS